MLPRSLRAEYFLVSRVVACSREPIARQIYRRRIYDSGVIDPDNPPGSRIKARGRLRDGFAGWRSHGLVQGRRTSDGNGGKNGRKLTASPRAGPTHRQIIIQV